MSDFCIVGVPAEDRAELESLAKNLEVEEDFGEHRYFDGATFVEIVLPAGLFSTGAWLTLRTWITARAKTRQSVRVSYRGVEITGASPADAERIIRLLGDAKEARDEDK